MPKYKNMRPHTCSRGQIQVEGASEKCNFLIYIALSAGGFAWSTAFGTTLSRIVSKLQGAPPSSHKYLLHPLASIYYKYQYTSISHKYLTQVSYTSIYYTLSGRPSHPLKSQSTNTSIYYTLSQVFYTRILHQHPTPAHKYQYTSILHKYHTQVSPTPCQGDPLTLSRVQVQTQVSITPSHKYSSQVSHKCLLHPLKETLSHPSTSTNTISTTPSHPLDWRDNISTGRPCTGVPICNKVSSLPIRIFSSSHYCPAPYMLPLCMT